MNQQSDRADAASADTPSMDIAASATALAARLPVDFVLGVATASYQVEGATREDGRSPSIWDAFSAMPGRVYQGHTGEIACDHYHRWREDLDLMQTLGVDAYRFSIAWPRIIPGGSGQVNAKGIAFYDRLIDGMLERGIAPHATLYHWDLPLALMAHGGWTSRITANAFAEYAEVIARQFGDRLESLATFNEPWCVCHLSHLHGVHAPGERNLDATLAAIHTLNFAHGLGVQAIRASADASNLLKVGVVINALPAYPGSDSAADIAAAERQFQFNNGVFFGPMFAGAYDDDFLAALGNRLPLHDGDLQAICQPLDFWGFNYYNPFRVVDNGGQGPWPHLDNVPVSADSEKTDLGWEIDASGLGWLLHKVYARYDRLPPCYITENGACYNEEPDADGRVRDARRIRYFDTHIAAVADAIDAGIDVRGYFAWSLMDNFEWAEGYRARFGLVHVDYDTQQRTIKDSGYWYQALARTHATNRA